MEREDNLEEFQKLIVQLKAIDVITLGKILDVDMKDQDGKHKDGEQIIGDIIQAFIDLPRRDRRTTLKIVRETIKRYH